MTLLANALLQNASKTYERKDYWEAKQLLGEFKKGEIPEGISIKPVQGKFGIQMYCKVGNKSVYYKIVGVETLEEAQAVENWKLNVWECVIENAEKNYSLGDKHPWFSPA